MTILDQTTATSQGHKLYNLLRLACKKNKSSDNKETMAALSLDCHHGLE